MLPCCDDEMMSLESVDPAKRGYWPASLSSTYKIARALQQLEFPFLNVKCISKYVWRSTTLQLNECIKCPFWVTAQTSLGMSFTVPESIKALNLCIHCHSSLILLMTHFPEYWDTSQERLVSGDSGPQRRRGQLQGQRHETKKFMIVTSIRRSLTLAPVN